MRLVGRLFVGVVVIALGASILSASTASTTTPPSSADAQDGITTPDDLKPSDCAGITLTDLVTGSGTITGTASNELILGSAVADTIDGLGGDDCILGGGGVDSITGGAGIDVCIGGGQVGDSFTTCETEVP